MIGQLLDRRYKIIQSLSVGGFGHTYIAEDLRIPGHPKCVVKHLKPANNNPKLLATAERLFWSEAESLTQLGTHDQIPRILAFFEENQEFFLVQELVEGHPLTEELIPEQKLTESYVIDLLKDVLPILEFIHQQDVIHRDIKPANLIRRQQDSKLVLIDFGAVKQVRTFANNIQDRRATVSIGTPGYMSTEQGRGKPRANSDIYGLGMIAIQALTGLEPFDLEEDSQGEIVWQDHASVSPGLADVVTKMVRYHFKDRYQSATEVLQALQQLENPADTPTVQDSIAVDTPGHELTLGWSEAGRRRTQIIRDQQVSKNPGTVRIGSDAAQCDIVLSEPTVSALHVELFFNSQQQRFYLRNLHRSNPAIVDGQYLPVGEVALHQGSTIRLGQLVLRVTTITEKQHSARHKPTEYVTQLQDIPPQLVDPTVQASNASDVEPSLTPINRPIAIVPTPSPPPVPLLRSKLFLLVGSGVVVAISAIATFALIILPQGKNQNAKSLNTSFEEQLRSQQCRIVSPTKREQTAKVRAQPLREAPIMTSVDKDVKVLYLGEQGAFVEIQFADGSKGWVYNDQIQPCQ